MRNAVMIMALLVLVGLIVNTGVQTFLWLKLVFKGIHPLVYGAVFGVVVFGVFALFITGRAANTVVPRAVCQAAHYAVGLLLYLVMIYNAASLIMLILRLARVVPSPVPVGARLASGILSLMLAAGLFIYGSVHWLTIQVRAYDVTLRNAQAAERTEEIQIALVSDLHMGFIVEETHLKKVVAAVNATKPDIVLIAGDIFDGDMASLADPEKLQALFREMNAPYGVYACLGNHDAGSDYDDMLKFLVGANVNLLRDEATVIDGKFILAGRADSSPIGGYARKRKPLELPQGYDHLPVIVIDHQPGNIVEYGENIDLVLSGHTHKGQMFPFNLITNAVHIQDYGYYKSPKGPQLIVTSGAATWGPPLRVASDNEIALIRVVLPAGG